VRLQNRRAFGAGVLVLGAALVLAGCGAGQITQTSTQQPAVNGSYAQVKSLLLRNAAVQYPASGPGYPAGADAPLTLTIVNTALQDDSLVSVTSEGAQSAVIGGSKQIVGGHSLVIGPDNLVESTTEVVPSSAAPTSSSAPASTSSPSSTSSSQAPSSSAPTSTSTEAPAVTVGKGTIVLHGLKQPLWPGQTIKVVFTFQNSGSIEIALPVFAPTKPGSAQG
jgi:copper(I)-binding protein